MRGANNIVKIILIGLQRCAMVLVLTCGLNIGAYKLDEGFLILMNDWLFLRLWQQNYRIAFANCFREPILQM